MLAFDWYSDDLGANPLEFFLRTTGKLTVIFLLLSLAITPLRKMLGVNRLIKYRRMIGLFAFFYAALHLVTYSIFDKSGNVRSIILDVWERPFIAYGMIAFVLLVPLAVTSTNGMIKRIGAKNWQILHRAVYAAAILGVVHYIMIQKSDYKWPGFAAVVLVALLGYRLFPDKRKGK